MSRRDQIKMDPAEIAAFLDAQRVVTCATNGRGGWPHLMPLWYVVRAGELWSWTYAASQKVRNLERDPRATLQLETGESYDQLRGVMIRANTVIHRETEVVEALGTEIFERYTGGGEGGLAPEVLEMVHRQAAKRVGLQFVPDGEPATWDHRKLGGTY